MNERFKFRVFDYDKNKMVYFSDLFSVVKPHHDRSSMPNYYNAYEYHKTSEYMQSIGLKDKNGKLIYEGDIIEWKKENHIVIFDERNATFGIKISDIETHLFNDIHTPTRWIEVIGNIYENKELLGVEE